MKIKERFAIYVILILFLINISYVMALDKSVPLIGAKSLHGLGITGEGKTVCVIDDGIDYTHPNLGGCGITNNINDGSCEKVIGGYDFGDNDENPIGTKGKTGHGTHVAGIIISNNSKYTGVAPDAKIIAIKIIPDDLSWTYDQVFVNIEKGLQWCIDNSTKYNLSVISMSLGNGTSIYGENCADLYGLKNEIEEAITKNILIVTSSGNYFQYMEGITYPACLSNVTSVGASTGRDKVWENTNRGDNLDLLAPGTEIRSTKAGGGFTGFLEDLCITNFLFCTSGTSFSSPHVSGGALLMLQYDPALKPFQIEKILKDTGKLIYDIPTADNYPRIDLLKALNVLDWPTYHHDNRRTGFTLLKGDIQAASKDTYDLVLSGGITSTALARPSIADTNNNGDQNVIVSFSKTGSIADGYISNIEYSKKWYQLEKRWLEDWTKNIGYAVVAPPSLGNTYGNEELEVVVGLKNGSLIVLNSNGNQKWQYHAQPKYSSLKGDFEQGNLGFTAIEDIDNDGKKEIIFTDYTDTAYYDWVGTLYILTDNGNSYTQEAIINISSDGGAKGAVAIANLDNDNNEEIVVPSYYGIKIYDYDSGSLIQKCGTNDSKIVGAPVIFDINRDNKYEIIYTTTNYLCYLGPCLNKLIVINASCSSKKDISTGIQSLVAPSVANLDSDSSYEIVIQGGNTVRAYDYETATADWTYTDTTGLIKAAPNIADIDGDGSYEVILAKNSTDVLILKNDGTVDANFTIAGQIGSSPVIGDLDGDGVAEIAVKRAGSDIAVLTELTGTNQMPELNDISNITMIAGQLKDINESGEIIATDQNNDKLTYYFSSPFNSSGLWHSTINDTGNYIILIEASDGNLSDSKLVDLTVFNYTTKLQNNFTDNSNKKSLSFSGVQNQSVQIRLPKNATIIYSRIKIKGGN